MLVVILGWLLFIAIVTAIVLGIMGIVKGYKGEAVFFYSWGDLVGISILVIAVTMGIAASLGNWEKSGNALWLFAAVLVLLFGLFLNGIVPFKRNVNKFDAVCVFFGRIIMGFSGMFMLFSFFFGGSGEKDRESGAIKKITTQLTWLALAYLFVRLAKRLVNGKEVACGNRVYN